ncbi:CoA-acylating methylmalonate-semialdehyde dehydrogenase [Paenibacillus herberti]|uniref:methylmalonate-semialdehyde dehydrogenase (CoA acylating) n=1 Tax=Paenibacillus herberti TaxID=1619309 RepID=A0A229P1N2_9BACL|nr:CoA-acylating methylmalonate-semialdehyde dehydrogenase [Paenibacillus herberti]OXM16163.1 methylmalonate-semialdehyde dehydrogenase (CoA acylating) [Paenibacillus herberti]
MAETAQVSETTATPRRLANWIGGRWEEASAETNYAPVLNPATGKMLAEVPLSGRAEVDLAVAAAAKAFQAWHKVPVPARARLFFRYQSLLVEHRDELAELLASENGKSLEEAQGEVQRGVECVEFAAGAPTLMMGSQLPDIANGLESGMFRYPLGVVCGVSPFNFPMMVPCWMFPLAVACGNAFVLKPSERTPLLACRLAELFQEAGIPPGVLSLVHGSREAVDALLDHPGIAAVSFVGSQPAAEAVYRRGTAAGKRVQALSGAKNHSIVLPDADLPAAARQVAAAAFGSAGQRCMACSVVSVQQEVLEPFLRLLLEQAEAMRPDGGGGPAGVATPMIRCESRDRSLGLVEGALLQGAELFRDGRLDPAPTGCDSFLGPTILTGVTEEMDAWREELFAPVLCVASIASLDEGIALANRSPFANGACLYTDSAKAVRRFREGIDAGMLGINIGVPAPMAFFPFSGYKNSFYGDLHANGKDGVEFYTRKKMVTARY